MASDRIVGLLGAVAVGVVLGFVLGGIGPRRDLAAAREELSRTRDALVKLQSRQARRAPLGVFGLGAMADAATPAGAAPEPASAEAVPATLTASPAPGSTAEQVTWGAPASIELDEFDRLVELARLRSEQSRAALIEQADLDDEQVDQLDRVFDEMNARLADYGEELLDVMVQADQADTTELLFAVHEVSGVLYDAQVDIDAVIGPDRIDDVDKDTREAWNYIDFEVFRDVVEAAGEPGQAAE